MNPQKAILSYEQVPFLSNQQIINKIQQNYHLVFYDQLIIDITRFNHPGGLKIVQDYVNNQQRNIKTNFQYFKHSDNANLILIQNVIGKKYPQNDKIKQSAYNSKQDLLCSGRYLYKSILQCRKAKLHYQALQKIDFSLPIYDQIQNNLSSEQKRIMTQIPKHFNQPELISFKSTFIKQLLYGNNFWVSSFSFQSMILVIVYLISKQMQQNVIKTSQLIINLMFLFFGLLKWTFIQYYFHRFLLHYQFGTKHKNIQHHLMHHTFPNKQNIIAISVHKVILYMISFYLVYSYIIRLEYAQVLFILLGLLTGLTFYDMIHYYCHFGPNIQISLLKKLKTNHLKHHFKNQNKGFGVSTTLWDRILGTAHQKLYIITHKNQ